jgi:hypothetical protein
VRPALARVQDHLLEPLLHVVLERLGELSEYEPRSVGVAFALAVGIGSAKAIERGWEIVFQKKRKDAVARE